MEVVEVGAVVVDVAGLDAPATADALAASQASLVAAEVAQVRLVAHWADLCNGETVPGGVLAGLERSVAPGGDGTPRVAEFAAAELGVLMGISTVAAAAWLRDVLDLRHRHPRLWSAVLAGRARFWQARQITRIAHHAGLDLAGARRVDERTAAHLGTVPWGRLIGLVEAAVIEADPEGAERRRLERAMERFVRTGQSNEHGLKTLYAQVEAGHAIGFVAMCDRIAQILAGYGDPDPIEVLRAKAVGWLGTPLRAAALLKQAEDRARGTTPAIEPDPTEPSVGPDLPFEARTDASFEAATEAHPQRPPDPAPAPHTGPGAPGDPPDPADAAGEGLGVLQRLQHGSAPQLVIDPAVSPDAFVPRSVLYVHLSLEQFLRRTRGAARVEGVGPVTLEAAVQLLHHTRVQVKPVIDLNRQWAVDGYQTPPRMAEQVALTTPVEVFPHGTTPARAADCDHVVPYWSPSAGGRPGQTSTTNLAPLGRHHHRVKTHGAGWLHRQPVPGVHYWRTRHGHWARVDQHGTHTLGRHLRTADLALLDTSNDSSHRTVPGASPGDRALAVLITGDPPAIPQPGALVLVTYEALSPRRHRTDWFPSRA